MHARAAVLLLFAIGLASCAQLRWQKAGADEAAISRDLSDCSKLAREKGARAGNLGLPPVWDPRFGAPVGPSQAEQQMQERQAADACMRERGYRLVPLEK